MSNVLKKDYSDYFTGRDWVHQVGFYAPDWRSFVVNHNRVFGSGPYFYTTNTFGKLLYYGEEVDCTGMEFRAAYGSWGAHSIEVVEQSDLSVPTMFTEVNDTSKPGFNHLHMFVDSLEEAQDACDFLSIPVITVGFPDFENALEKARATGMNESVLRTNAGKPSFMVCDMRKEVGYCIQLIEPRAKNLHDAILNARDKWDGSDETLLIPMGGKH